VASLLAWLLVVFCLIMAALDMYAVITGKLRVYHLFYVSQACAAIYAALLFAASALSGERVPSIEMRLAVLVIVTAGIADIYSHIQRGKL